MKVLVVEDSFEIRLALEMSLRQDGWQVIVAVDGNDGLQKFRQHEPDLVVLDLRMPGLDGRDVCRKIRQTSDAPVIIFSALDQSEEVQVAIAAGASDFVLKSSGMDELLKRVRSWSEPQGTQMSERTGEKAASRDRKPDTKGLDVLILDSDFKTATILSNHFMKSGHNVRTVRMVDRELSPGQPDIVVLDYATPKRVGVDLVETLCKNRDSRPLGLIIASRANPPELRRKVRDCLLLDFIEKPWQAWELPLRLTAAVDLYTRRTKMSA